MAGTIVKLRGAMKPGVWNTEVKNVFSGDGQACIEMIVSSEVPEMKQLLIIAKERKSLY